MEIDLIAVASSVGILALVVLCGVAPLVAQHCGRWGVLRIGFGRSPGALARSGSRLGAAVVLSMVLAGCGLLMERLPVIGVWAQNETSETYLLRVSIDDEPQVFFFPPGAMGWAVGAEAPRDVEVEVLTLTCEVLGRGDLPESDKTLVEVEPGPHLVVGREPPPNDPFAELMDLAQTCGSIRMCPVVSPWPTGVPEPTERC